MGRLLASLRHALGLLTGAARRTETLSASTASFSPIRTEADWLTCADPTAMLQFIQSQASERKRRLFAIACCRLIWHLFSDERSCKVVEVAERLTDRLADEEERQTALALARETVSQLPVVTSGREEDYLRAAVNASMPTIAALAARATIQDDGGLAYFWCLFAAYKAADDKAVADVNTRTAQVVALRDIFGNPFRLAPVIEPAVLAWNDRTVVRLAQRAYEERSLPDGTLDLARLAILADALEEAGVTDTLLLKHLRGPGPHVRGCFAIDAILGRT